MNKTAEVGQKRAFVKLLNFLLLGDPLAADYLPINPESESLYKAATPGVFLNALINKLSPNTINVKSIKLKPKNKSEALANHELTLKGAQSIGCQVSSITANQIYDAKKHVVLELIWQIVRRGLVEDVSVRVMPQLLSLREESEEISKFSGLAPEDLLLRWCRFHVHFTFPSSTISGFSDLQDGIFYLALLHHLDETLNALSKTDAPSSRKRLEDVLNLTELFVGAPTFFDAELLETDDKFRMALLAILFQVRPSLDDAPSSKPNNQNRQHSRRKISKIGLGLSRKQQPIQTFPSQPPSSSSFTNSFLSAATSQSGTLLEDDTSLSSPKSQISSSRTLIEQTKEELSSLENGRTELVEREREVSKRQRQIVKKERELSVFQKRPAFASDNPSLNQLHDLSSLRHQIQVDSVQYLSQQEEMLTTRLGLVNNHIKTLTDLNKEENLPDIQNTINELNHEKYLLETQIRRLRDEIEDIKSSSTPLNVSVSSSLDNTLFREHRPGFRKIFITGIAKIICSSLNSIGLKDVSYVYLSI
eukprot:TRINITY_DN4900_c0_g1_i2.p1 TRINITY_DN4900_c0_g1~~TRINITY_DN4900_c0_g1_i2.p1  ORF type:complete len:533 (+),score=138.59 TRINITY_DN4900_c0_g1_i2:46-1644(+)